MRHFADGVRGSRIYPQDATPGRNPEPRTKLRARSSVRAGLTSRAARQYFVHERLSSLHLVAMRKM